MTTANTARKASPFAARMAANAAPAASDAPVANDRPQAQVYLNFGYFIDVPTEDGGTAEEFISLPFGLPLDTMNQSKMSGNNTDFANKLHARNKFLADLLEHADTLAPGESSVITYDENSRLAVEIRRRGSPAEAAADDNNPYLRRTTFAEA